MKQCKNPECQKEIPDSLNYCNEQCLRRHIEIKKLNKQMIPEPEENTEETAIEYMKRRNEEKAKGIEKPKHTPIGLIQNTPEGINEVNEIMQIFGFKHSDGNIVGMHNATILSFLRQEQGGVYQTMINKLTWICHTSNRNIRENFLKGIEDFGIIETYLNEFNVLKWRWIGIKALTNNGGEKEE